MNKEITKQILEKLESQLNIDRDDDFIGELFETRAETIHIEIIHNELYQEYHKKIGKIEDEIIKKFDNAWEIINTVEKHENKVNEMGHLCEKLMYKYGIYDGMKLIIEGINKIDINEQFKNKQKE